MKLADGIYIEIGGERVELRPSLRHAIRHSRRPGSFSRLAREVMEGSLTAACDLISDHHPHAMLEAHILDAGLDRLREPLILYITQLAGVDDDPKPRKPATGTKQGKPLPFSEFLLDLYKKATGWLLWTPEVALDATPAEIMLAMEGHMEMLKAVHGSAEKPATPEALTAEKARAVLGGKKIVKIKRSKEASA